MAKSRATKLKQALPRDPAKVPGLTNAQARTEYRHHLDVFDACGIGYASRAHVISFCETCALARKAYADVMKKGHTLTSARTGGAYLNPSVNAWKMALDQLEKFSRFLSISPDLLQMTIEDIEEEETQKAAADRREATLVEFTRKTG